jgi:hypothetical protein
MTAHQQLWIFSVRPCTESDRRDRLGGIDRYAAVGPASIRTVEAALRRCSDFVAAAVRGSALVHDFIEGKLDAHRTGYYASTPVYCVCIGPVDEVVS